MAVCLQGVCILSLTIYIEEMGAERVLKSTWAVKLENTNCKEIRKKVKEYLKDKNYDLNGSLLVSKPSDWAGIRLENSPHDV